MLGRSIWAICLLADNSMTHLVSMLIADYNRQIYSELSFYCRPQEGIPKQPQQDAPSPVAAHSGQLRRVRLDPGSEAASPVKQGLGNKENDGGQVSRMLASISSSAL